MADLGPAGQAFFDDLKPCIKLHPKATEALIREAARLLDRLNDLDDIIDGKGVLNLLHFRLVTDDGDVAEVKFDAVLSEARQQQTAFTNMVKAILPNLESAAQGKAVDPLDQLAARRAARGGATSRLGRTSGGKG